MNTRRRWRDGLCGLAGLYLLVATSTARAAGPSFALSPAGELTIKLGDHVVATGNWALQTYGRAAIPEADLLLVQPTVAVAPGATATHAVVTHTYPTFDATYDYTLAGEDLRIAAHLTNRDPAKTLRRVHWYGPTFHFARDAGGTLHSWHWTYVWGEWLALFHPSTRNPLGCVCAYDDAFGFAVHSTSEFDREDLFNATFQKDGIIPAECRVEFYTTRAVPPGGSADVDVTFRVSPDHSIPHLLGGYRAVHAAHFPILLYTPDARPVAQFAGTDSTHVTPTNPGGYNGDWRRLDTELGVARYVRAVAPPLERAGAMGILFWSPGGCDPPQYPPDFDVFPPSVERNLPTLVRGFHDHHLRVGLCARCGDGVRRPPGKPPEVYRLSADDPAQMAEMLGRFRRATDLGFDAFYLDTFGSDGLNDLRMLGKIRAAVGPDVLLYTEFGSDMTLPLAGHYCEWRANGLLWTGPDQLASLRYLCPRSTWLAISRTDEPVPKAVRDLGLTPLVQDAVVQKLPPAAGAEGTR